MDEPLEHSYFNWLCTKVNRVENSTPSLSYDNLFRIMHNTEFVWAVAGDDNRATDGVELRWIFLQLMQIDDPQALGPFECSMFELLIALADRAAFMTTLTQQEWFWLFLSNLGLDECTDAYGAAPESVLEILDYVIWRRYQPNGHGGLFPLEAPPQDQTKVELWYQLASYIIQHIDVQ